MSKSTRDRLRDWKFGVQALAGFGVAYVRSKVKDELLPRNKDFKLIHVQEKIDGTKPSMEIVIPALNTPIRREVREKGYFTVSHLWGPKEQWTLWTTHGIIGTDGQAVQVKIRPEKQDTLLQLLQSRPGFWWIDVFCAQSKAPPYIMGDVYRYCEECFALVDFPAAGFKAIENISTRLQSFESEEELFQNYYNRTKDKMGFADQPFHVSFDRLLGGWYDGDSDDIKAVGDFFSCQWFTRVWTLQEYLLPPDLTFVSEMGPSDCSFNRSMVASITETMCTVASKAMARYTPQSDGMIQDIHVPSASDEYEHISSTPGLSCSHFDLTRFDAFQLYDTLTGSKETKHLILMDIRYGSSKWDMLVYILLLFARLPRTCMYTEDYIYGVSGLLGMNIPMGLKDKELWASFRRCVQKRAPYLDVPETSPLSGAKNMQDVYGVFVGLDVSVFLDNMCKLNSADIFD